MNNRKHIQDELEGLNSHLPDTNNQGPFSVPEGYFDGLAASIMAKINGGSASQSAAEEIAELSPLLAGISRTMPYELPAGYFTTLEESLPAFTSDEASPVLAAIGKTMPYEVPQGYFSSLADQVLETVQPKARVIPMIRRKWMKMAVAASVAGILALSGYFYLNGKNGASSASNADNAGWVAKQLKGVSPSVIKEFIENTDANVIHDAATAQNKGNGKSDVKKLLKDVSDKELNEFLSQVPSDDELAIN